MQIIINVVTKQGENCIRMNKKPSKFILNISRTRLKKYVGKVTGNPILLHLIILGKSTDSSCDLCGENMETANYFLYNWPALITARKNNLGGYNIRYNLIRSLQPSHHELRVT